MSGFWGRLKFRTKQSHAVVEKTKIPSEVVKVMEDWREYAAVIKEVNAGFLLYVQPSVTNVPHPVSDQNCVDEDAMQSPAYMLSKEYAPMIELWAREELRKTSDYALYNTYEATRDFQVKARAGMHFMRTFLTNDYASLKRDYRTVQQYRDKMDELKANLIDSKTNMEIPSVKADLTATTKQYEEWCKVILSAAHKLPLRKQEHYKEIIALVPIIEMYHVKVVKALGWITKLKNRTAQAQAEKKAQAQTTPVKDK